MAQIEAAMEAAGVRKAEVESLTTHQEAEAASAAERKVRMSSGVFVLYCTDRVVLRYLICADDLNHCCSLVMMPLGDSLRLCALLKAYLCRIVVVPGRGEFDDMGRGTFGESAALSLYSGVETWTWVACLVLQLVATSRGGQRCSAADPEVHIF
jgi:hypothetical protein